MSRVCNLRTLNILFFTLSSLFSPFLRCSLFCIRKSPQKVHGNIECDSHVRTVGNETEKAKEGRKKKSFILLPIFSVCSVEGGSRKIYFISRLLILATILGYPVIASEIKITSASMKSRVNSRLFMIQSFLCYVCALVRE